MPLMSSLPCDPLPEALSFLVALAERGRPVNVQLQVAGCLASLTIRPALAAAPSVEASVAAVPGETSPPAAPWHAEDWRLVAWPGLGRFVLGKKQGAVVKRLWQAWQEGSPGVPQQELLRLADSDGDRLRDLFRVSAAWGTLVRRGAIPGTYTLPVDVCGSPAGPGNDQP